MSNDSSISHSSTATPPEAAPALYAVANCDINPVETTMALGLNRDNGKQQMIAQIEYGWSAPRLPLETRRDRDLARGWADALDGWGEIREASVGLVRRLMDDGTVAA